MASTVLDSLRPAIVDLSRQYEGVFSRDTIERFVVESYEELAKRAKVDNYLHIFAERFARDRLRALARAEGWVASGVPEVLFVCVRNAGRSQMAAGLLDHYANGTVHVRSAGSDPSDSLHRAVIEVMLEKGIDIRREFPKPLTDEVVRGSDVVITMGCGDACPVYPGKRYLDWNLDDPEGKGVDQVRHIRDVLEFHVRGLLAELVPDTST